MGMIDHFGMIAPFYNKIFSRKEKPMCLDFLPEEFEGLVMDLGGGSGRISTWLESNSTKIILADVSLKMLSHARRFDGLFSVCCESEQLCFAPARLDAVLMVDAFHHVSDQRRTLEEIWRVLKPGGRLIIEEPDIRTWQVKLIALMEKILIMRSHFESPFNISRMLLELGAEVEIHYDKNKTTAFVVAIKNR